jgi:periplasmic mercuric ion binding protein
MKTLVIFAIAIIAITTTAFTIKKQKSGETTSTFKVWGNCGMCKTKIEKSLKVKGVSKANWDDDTKIMTVTYEPAVITLDQIQKNIAAVGYDTELYKAENKAYKKLPGCCQYERK